MGKLTCPHCGSITSFSPVMLEGDGISVGESSELHTRRRRVQLEAITDEKYMDYQARSRRDFLYAVLECQGCNEWFVAGKARYGGEWSAVYPIPHRPVAKEIPEPIKSEFEEAHLCFAVGAYRGCLLICRTTLVAMQREQMVSGLDALVANGIISPTLLGQAHEVRLWGNIMAHEPVLPEEIDKDDVEQLLAYLEILLDAIYVQPKRLSELTQKREKLKKKPKPKARDFFKPDSGISM